MHFLLKDHLKIKTSQCKYIVLIIDGKWYDYMIILKYNAFFVC